MKVDIPAWKKTWAGFAVAVTLLSPLAAGATFAYDKVISPPLPSTSCASMVKDVNTDLDQHPEDASIFLQQRDSQVDRVCGSGTQATVVRLHKPPSASSP